MTAIHTYSGLERILHRTAFSAISAQIALDKVENYLLATDLKAIQIRKPVFITALPRAGTTLLLEILSNLPEFATHTYRDMPFVLCPIIWDKISAPFRQKASQRVRAHDDGIAIGFDSPEAFEEVVWKAFWPDKYHRSHIEQWTTARNAEFEDFLRNHMCKIIALHSNDPDDFSKIRYLSKNNANISRLRLLPRLFPDCDILIPIRNPWDHAESLRHQHKRFCAIHAEDKFSQTYMEWLGHYEFGAALRPLNFDNWQKKACSSSPDDILFWLAYWEAAHAAILSVAGSNITFIDYDCLCRDPSPILTKLADRLEIKKRGNLKEQSSRFRPATEYKTNTASYDVSIQNRLNELYARLLESCL